MKKEDEVVVAMLGCGGIFPAMVASYLLRAWAVTTLWNWFVFPQYHITCPSYPYILGLSCLISLFQPYEESDTKGKSVTEVMTSCYAKLLLRYPLAVVFGWILHKFA